MIYTSLDLHESPAKSVLYNTSKLTWINPRAQNYSVSL